MPGHFAARLNSSTRSQWIGFVIARVRATGDGGAMFFPVDRRAPANHPGLGAYLGHGEVTMRFGPGEQVCFGLNRLEALAEEETGGVHVEGYLTDRL